MKFCKSDDSRRREASVPPLIEQQGQEDIPGPHQAHSLHNHWARCSHITSLRGWVSLYRACCFTSSFCSFFPQLLWTRVPIWAAVFVAVQTASLLLQEGYWQIRNPFPIEENESQREKVIAWNRAAFLKHFHKTLKDSNILETFSSTCPCWKQKTTLLHTDATGTKQHRAVRLRSLLGLRWPSRHFSAIPLQAGWVEKQNISHSRKFTWHLPYRLPLDS